MTSVSGLIDLVYSFQYHIIQNCSGITHGRVLNRHLYAQRLQKLIYLHLFTDRFMKISLQSSEQTYMLTQPFTFLIYRPTASWWGF